MMVISFFFFFFALLNLGIDEVDQTSSLKKFANKPREMRRKSKYFLQNNTQK